MKSFEIFNGGRITKSLLKNFKKFNNKLTDFMVAIIDGDMRTFNKMIDTVDLEEMDRDGNTALLIASANDRLKMLKKLIKSGANIQHKNNNGEDFYDVTENRYTFLNLTKDYIEKNFPDFIQAKKYNL